MSCYPIAEGDRTIGHICTTGPFREVRRKPGRMRWCFGCRAHLPHDWVLFDTIEPSYWGPWCRYDCSRCHQDRTCFPGCEREWDYG